MRIACLALAASLTASLAFAAAHGPERRSAMMIDALGDQLTSEESAIKARRAKIDAELAALDRAALKDTDWAKQWAGTYYTGDGLGENASVHLAPVAGISFLNYGCLGLYGGDHGEIVAALPDGLKLKLTFGSAKDSFLSERMYFVTWGDQRFLVPDWQMTRFINNYNEGGYARASMYGILRLIRDGEQPRRLGDATAPAGRPQLPEQFAKLLRNAAVPLKVTKSEPQPVRQVTNGVEATSCILEFEGGSDHGMYLNMEFRYPRGDITLATGNITITRVDAATCSGTLTAFALPGTKVKLPVVGDVVYTGGDLPSEPKEGPK